MDESEEDNIKIFIGPFIITNKQLGDGTSGSVRLGIHEGTKETVAIKEIRKKKYEIISERISNNELEEIKNERELLDSTLLEQEIEIFKILHHPYICRYYYKANYNSDCYIVSEYLKNKNIIDYICDSLESGEITFNIFDEKFICKIFCQMLSAIEYLHNNYIVHRDIKLENTIFDEYGDIKLTDFGFSKKLKKGEYLQDHRGSEIYSSPEVILYEDDYDGYLADIWSLGVCLFFLIFNDYPFSADQDFKEKLRDSDLTFPESEASDLVKDLIKKILEKNPKKRISIAQIKQHPWIKSINFDFNKSRGIYLDKDIIPIDTNVVREIGGKNEQKIKKIIKDILTNAHNNNTCTYYLKIEQRKRKNIKSIADIRPTSDLFINYINSEKSQLKYYNNDIDKIVEIYTANIMAQIQEEEQAFKKVKNSMIDEKNLNKIIENNNNIDNIDNENKIKQIKEKMKKRSNSFGKLKVLKKSMKEENSKNLLNAKNVIKVNKANIINKKLNNMILVYGILEDIIKKALNSIKDNKKEEIEQINNINIGKKSAEEKIKKNNFTINVIEEFGFMPSIQKADKTAPFGFYKPKNKLKEIKTKESGEIKEEKNKNKLFDKNKNKRNKIESKNLISSKYTNHSTIDIKLTDKKKTKILKTEENNNKTIKNKNTGIIHSFKTKIANAYKSIKNKFHKEKKINNDIPNKIKSTKPKKRSNSFDINSRHDLYKLIHDKEVKVLLSKKRHKSQNKDLKSMSSPQKKGKKLEKKAEKFINKKVNKNPIRINEKILDTNLNINEEISKRRLETKNINNIPKPKKNLLKKNNNNRNNRKLNFSMSCTLTPNSERSDDKKNINTRTITQENTNKKNNDKSIIKKKTKIAGKTFLIFRNNNKNSTINKTKTNKPKIFKSMEVSPKKATPIKTSIFKKDINSKKSAINIKQSIHSSRQKNLNKFDLESNSKDTIDTSSRKKSFVINSKINTQRKSINKKLRINSIDLNDLRKKEDYKQNEIKVKKDSEKTKEIISNYFGEENTTVTKSKSGIKITIKMFFGKNKLEFKLNLIQADKNKCNITAELIKGDSKNFDEIFLKLKEKLK